MMMMMMMMMMMTMMIVVKRARIHCILEPLNLSEDYVYRRSRCCSIRRTNESSVPDYLALRTKVLKTMLSYMLPTEDKPPPGEPNQNHQKTPGSYRNSSRLQKSPREQAIRQKSSPVAISVGTTSPKKFADGTRTMILSGRIDDQSFSMDRHDQQQQRQNEQIQQQLHHQQHSSLSSESPKHNGTLAKKSTLHNSARVTKDDSLYSIDSDASTIGSDRKNKILNGAKHASLKRVSFGSSKGSMVETLVYETPVQEEPEINQFLDHNGRLPPPMIPVPDTDEGREKVRVSLLGPQPSPATPGVLLLEPIAAPIGHPIDMSASPAELLTTHADHTTPTYHTQISTDSGWDNPFRPDGDLSREADEIVELIKGGKPITPTPGQTAPPLPGCEETDKSTPGGDHDSSSSPLLKSNANSTNRHSNASPRLNQGNGNAHGTPIKSSTVNSQLPANEKVGSASRTVEVARMTAQGPGDASQVEHVTLKKKPKCKCCVLQ